MKKELLFSVLLATGLAAASFQSAAEWQDKTGEAPEEPPEELRAAAAAAAAAAPGAIPLRSIDATPAELPPPPLKVGAIAIAPAPAPALVAAVAAPAPAPASEPAPAPEPVVSAPQVLQAPVSAPPVEEVRSVTPAVSTWNTTKSYAVVLRPVSLRARPVASGAGDLVEAETRVRLESSTVNADGVWWFVTAPGVGGGWLLESEMGSPQR